jgi:hypothetical protein
MTRFNIFDLKLMKKERFRNVKSSYLQPLKLFPATKYTQFLSTTTQQCWCFSSYRCTTATNEDNIHKYIHTYFCTSQPTGINRWKSNGWFPQLGMRNAKLANCWLPSAVITTSWMATRQIQQNGKGVSSAVSWLSSVLVGELADVIS